MKHCLLKSAWIIFLSLVIFRAAETLGEEDQKIRNISGNGEIFIMEEMEVRGEIQRPHVLLILPWKSFSTPLTNTSHQSRLEKYKLLNPSEDLMQLYSLSSCISKEIEWKYVKNLEGRKIRYSLLADALNSSRPSDISVKKYLSRNNPERVRARNRDDKRIRLQRKFIQSSLQLHRKDNLGSPRMEKQ